MEPFKEIVNINEYFFFKGLADFKYYGKKEKLKSNNLNEEHFKHSNSSCFG